MGTSKSERLQLDALMFNIKAALALALIAGVGLVFSFVGSPMAEIGGQLAASRPLMLIALGFAVLSVILSALRMRRLGGAKGRNLQ